MYSNEKKNRLPFGDVRSVLHQPPGRKTFNKIVDLSHSYRLSNESIDYIKQIISTSWNSEIKRTIPPTWMDLSRSSFYALCEICNNAVINETSYLPNDSISSPHTQTPFLNLSRIYFADLSEDQLTKSLDLIYYNKLDKLWLKNIHVSDVESDKFNNAVESSNLISLSVSRCKIQGLLSILLENSFPDLKRLRLSCLAYSLSDFVDIVSSEMKMCETLDFSYNLLRKSQPTNYARIDLETSIRNLDLSYCELTIDLLRVIYRLGVFKNLENINIEKNRFSAKNIVGVFSMLKGCVSVNFNFNRSMFCKENESSILKLNFPNLLELKIAYNDLSDNFLQKLIESDLIFQIKKLQLSGNNFSQKKVLDFVKIVPHTNLEILDLENLPISEIDLMKFLTIFKESKLRALVVSEDLISPQILTSYMDSGMYISFCWKGALLGEKMLDLHKE